jgi:hypothetical protein
MKGYLIQKAALLQVTPAVMRETASGVDADLRRRLIRKLEQNLARVGISHIGSAINLISDFCHKNL